jgi:single-strand DNA-binding protein
MARSVNKVILLGNLGRDAELSYTPSGQPLSKVSLATSRRWQDKASGDWQEETEWHNLVIWGKTAENMTQYLTKGQRVFIEGRIKSRTWEKEGVKHYATDIIVENLVLAGGRSEGSGEPRPRPNAAAAGAAKPAPRPAAQAPEEGPVEDITDDDIPF